MFNFNQQQPQQQNQSGGLFGTTNVGLTGNPNSMNQGNPGQQAGLWGNQPSMGMTNQNPNTGTKSLFGQPSGMTTGMTSTTGGGLFGQTQPPQQQTGGLFGSTGTGMGTSTLFGGGQQTGPIPMSGGTTVGSVGGGLFGNQPQQPQQTAQTPFGGFGQQQPQQFGQGQGLLGQGLQSQQQGQGLFGQQIGQQQMGQPQQPQTGGLFGSTGFGQGIGMNQPQQQQGMMGLGGGQFGTMQQQQPTTQQPGLISSSIFGGTGTGMMGSNVPTTKPTGLFGQTNISTSMPSNQMQMGMQQSFMGGTQVSTVSTGTYPMPYQPIQTQEQSNQNGQQKLESINLVAITAMEIYSKKSFEELRYEDFKNKKQGLVPPKLTSTGITGTTGAYGGTISGSGFQQLQQPSVISNIKQPQIGQRIQQGGTSLFKTGMDGCGTTGPMLSMNTGVQQQVQQSGFGMTSQPGFGQATTGFGTGLGMTAQPQLQQNVGGGGLFSKPQQATTLNLGLFNTTGGVQPGGTLVSSLQSQPSFATSTITPNKPITGGLFSTNIQPQLQMGTSNLGQPTSLFSSTSSTTLQQPQQQPSGLFCQTTQTQQPSTTGGLFSSMSGVGKPLTGGLFSNTPSMTTTQQPMGPLFSGQSTIQSSTIKPQEYYPGTTQQVQQVPMYAQQSLDYKNFLTSSLSKQKTITDILNDLQRDFVEQDLLFNDYKKKEKTKEINLAESKYSYVPVLSESEQNYRFGTEYDYRDRTDMFGSSFLKSKRTYGQPKYYEPVGGKVLQPPTYNFNRDFRKELVPSVTPVKAKDMEYEYKTLKASKIHPEEEEPKVLSKSKSCDLIKTIEKKVVNKLEQSFNEKVNIEDEQGQNGQIGNFSRQKISDNTYLDLQVTLQDPIKINSNIKINKNSKLNALKNAIVETLQNKNPKMFKKSFNTNSFVLMRKYSILKDGLTLSESEIKDGDVIYILLKENFNYESSDHSNNTKESSNSHKESPSRKESKADKTKKKSKNELAPLDKLPILTKTGYKTIPDFRNICRISLDELENVENFSIYNDYGRIDFEGKTNLTNLNLDQIVTIDDKKINVYQNGDFDFKPPKGQGLNKSAVLHLNKCFPNEDGKNLSDEDFKEYMSSLQKVCKNKNAEYMSYDKTTGEWIFKVECFLS